MPGVWTPRKGAEGTLEVDKNAACACTTAATTAECGAHNPGGVQALEANAKYSPFPSYCSITIGTLATIGDAEGPLLLVFYAYLGKHLVKV
ncbi:hypothetical protein CYMTET_47999 [Cymbomonas tetramitiformis]|uniref:Uncharacterized protein n=1 Tax=Cymbomonas tetramitiformis TaxID=36881 RepID=A0AAE0BT51_9CHLO|nr:hypothetical protein CYMTET_47999 [Cymbomonas tetramitiformis]